MPTEAQYAAIGELAITFNDLEYLIDGYVYHLLQCREDNIPFLVIPELFHKKRDLLRRLVAMHTLRFPGLGALQCDFHARLDEAATLAAERNKLIHSDERFEDLYHKNQRLNADPAHVRGLSSKCRALVESLANSGAAFLAELEQIQAMAR